MAKQTYANTVAYEVPDSLDALSGLATGVLELPRSLYWGPETTTDLSNTVDVQRMYQAVVRTGTVEEQTQWLNKGVLIANWHNLVLPSRCVEAWESRFSELRA